MIAARERQRLLAVTPREAKALALAGDLHLFRPMRPQPIVLAGRVWSAEVGLQHYAFTEDPASQPPSMFEGSPFGGPGAPLVLEWHGVLSRLLGGMFPGRLGAATAAVRCRRMSGLTFGEVIRSAASGRFYATWEREHPAYPYAGDPWVWVAIVREHAR